MGFGNGMRRRIFWSTSCLFVDVSAEVIEHFGDNLILHSRFGGVRNFLA